MVVGERSCSTGAALNLRIQLFAAHMLHQNIRDSNMAMIYLADGAPLMYLGKSGISLRQASKKAKLDRNSLINNLKNVTFNITFWINFHLFCMQNVTKYHVKVL